MKYRLWLILVVSSSLHAQKSDLSQDKKMELAFRYLNGMVKAKNPEKAFALFKDCANQGNPQAMNDLGIQYKNGIGVKEDNLSALYWFRLAAANGYPAAWFNLGVMYKYGTGCELNYTIAYQCFKKAADSNDLSGIYSQAYMLYKGLGCDQNYHKAVVLFRKAAFMGSPSSMYFLGLCFRSGYGIAKNYDSANYWLQHSIAKNYQFAMDELIKDKEENSFASTELLEKIKRIQGSNTAANSYPINKYTKVKTVTPIEDLAGSYAGYIVGYDYSGAYIISGRSLSVNLSQDKENRLSGTWTEDGIIRTNINASMVANVVVFKNTNYQWTDRYNTQIPSTYQFDLANLQLLKDQKDSIFLVGNLELYVLDKKEPQKPLSIILKRTLSEKIGNETFSKPVEAGSNINLNVFPNPFKELINVEFTLQKEEKVYTQLFTTDGKLLFTSGVDRLEAGKYRLPISVTVPVGSYIVMLHCGTDTKSAIAIKQY